MSDYELEIAADPGIDRWSPRATGGAHTLFGLR